MHKHILDFQLDSTDLEKVLPYHKGPSGIKWHEDKEVWLLERNLVNITTGSFFKERVLGMPELTWIYADQDDVVVEGFKLPRHPAVDR